jgi:hypothetical protein
MKEHVGPETVKIDPPPASLRRGKQFFAELKRRNVTL